MHQIAVMESQIIYLHTKVGILPVNYDFADLCCNYWLLLMCHLISLLSVEHCCNYDWRFQYTTNFVNSWFITTYHCCEIDSIGCPFHIELSSKFKISLLTYMAKCLVASLLYLVWCLHQIWSTSTTIVNPRCRVPSSVTTPSLLLVRTHGIPCQCSFISLVQSTCLNVGSSIICFWLLITVNYQLFSYFFNMCIG